MPWGLMPVWKKLRVALNHFNHWQVILARRNANRIAAALAKLGPPLEILFTLSLPIHIQEIYSQELFVQEDRTLNQEEQRRRRMMLNQGIGISNYQSVETSDASNQEATNLELRFCNDNGPLSQPFVPPFML